MVSKSNTIHISLECAYDQWWRYNIYVAAATFSGGNRADYQSLTDTVYPLGNGAEVRLRPSDYDPRRPIELQIAAADTLELFVYVIPNTMPISETITQSPPFPIQLRIKGGGISATEQHMVNQWGGLSLHKTY